jgi:[acyl-carrier-protein] S-malonyltransferase
VTLAFVFPGQGARDVSTALSWAHETEAGRALLGVAEAATNVAFDDVMKNGARLLESTRVLQPFLVAACLSVLARTRALGVTPDVVLGHSLGEVSALAAANVLSAEEAVQLAATRGGAMEHAGIQTPGGLVAVGSMDAASRAMAAIDGLELGLHNAADEVVLTGPAAAIAQVVTRFGGKRVPVSGPWHSRAMTSAVQSLQEHAQRLPLRHSTVRIASGATTALELAARLTQPVDFVGPVSARNSDRFLVIGPGHVLRGLLRRILGPDAVVLTTESEADLQRSLKRLEEAR